MAAVYEVILLGLGGMGSAAACHLSVRGKRVLGLERFGPAHSNGSSHGDSRIIRQAYHEHPDYVPLVRRAYQLWERLERDTGESILHKTGGLMIGPPGSSVVEGALLSASQHQLPVEVLNAAEIKRRYPILNPRPNDSAVYEAAAGYLRPEAAIHAHLQLAAERGAHLHFQERVLEWSAHPGGDGVSVKTGLANYEAEHLVIAPGAWAPDLLADLQVPFEIRRHVMCWFQSAANSDLFKTGVFPIYIWDVDGVNCFYGFPATGAASDGVKAAMHSGGQACSPHNVDRNISGDDVSEVRHYLERFIPSLNGQLLRAATCLYTMSPDAHFIVGPHPDHPQVSIAAGFSGHGFKFTSVMGEILADLACHARTQNPIGFLSLRRFQC